MATASTLAVILVLCLVLGWRYHFRVVEHRRAIMQMSQQAEKVRLATAYSTESARPAAVTATPGTVVPAALTAPPETEVVLRYDPAARKVPETTEPEVLPLTALTDAEGLVRKYADTTHWQDRLQFVSEPERVRALMEDYYEVQQNVDPVIGTLIDQKRLRIGGAEIIQLNFRGSRVVGRLELLMRRTGTNRLVIDWESLVGYSQKSFSELSKTRPSTPVLVRGYVTLDDYYSHEFSDSLRYLSLKVTSPDGTGLINVYCPRDGEMASWLQTNLRGSLQESQAKACTLWISYPEKAESGRCANLLQVQASQWLILPKK
ncbi:hypothetical protein [Brevifollis gellanilyticus]|uniref:Uncharacterized protein n=1 Tax=Brevifollis gellanilyticus TaxID=748831 RepID=A0A512M5P1_9BACT|nr:hypothetical protein [Brevifollis gellanilyticus]GEP42053.1 hypothetical protein BGE01nite_13440 [Brevifollis gellanilyticus]